MLDTLTPHFFPQYRRGPRQWNSRTLTAMTAYRNATGYALTLRTVPDHSSVELPPNASFEGRLTVPPGSYLWAITASSSAAAGFDLQIRDNSTQAELCGRRTTWRNLSGQPAAADSPQSRQFLLPKPMLFADQIIVQITNRAATNNTVQVVLWLAAKEGQQ